MGREAVILKKRNIDDLEDLQPTSDPSEDRLVSTPVSTSSTPTAINMPATDHIMSGSILRDISFSDSQGDVSIYGHRDWDDPSIIESGVWRDPAANESLVECPGICGATRDEWSATDAHTPVTLEEAVLPAVEQVESVMLDPISEISNVGTHIQANICWSGSRKDRGNKALAL